MDMFQISEMSNTDVVGIRLMVSYKFSNKFAENEIIILSDEKHKDVF